MADVGLSDREIAEWEARYERVKKAYQSHHVELQELIEKEYEDILFEYYDGIPAIEYMYNTGGVTTDALFIIIPVMEEVLQRYGKLDVS